jgi:predicted transcriptional regulator
MRRLLAADQGRLAVLIGGRVAGIITRHDILHFIAIRTELEKG